MSAPTLDDLRRALDELAAVDDLAAVLPEGERGDCALCPVALWLSARLGVPVGVTASRASIDGSVRSTRLPDRITEWIVTFDLDGVRDP